MATDKAGRKQVEAEPCRCVYCSFCGGDGVIRVSGYGLDDLETCEECGGSRISETCDRCQLLNEMDYENEVANG